MTIRRLAAAGALLGAACAADGSVSNDAADADLAGRLSWRAEFDQAPWPVRLGLRVAQVDNAFPVVDEVVVVPDAATFLDELERWSPAGRWPVLLEGEHAAAFVRAFRPARVVRRASVGALPSDPESLRRRIEAVVVRTFGGDAAVATPADRFAALGYRPPGLVVTSAIDPAWTGAAALAAGRGLPIAWMDDRLPGPNAALDATATDALLGRVRAALDASGLSWRALGDDLDAVVFCRSAPARAVADLPPGARVDVQPAPEGHAVRPNDPLALTDLLGRTETWDRGAFAGWVLGDEAHAAYRAMASLFLPRASASLFNGYPTDGAWGAYDTAPAAERLRARGASATSGGGGESPWLESIRTGAPADLFFLNSSGNADFFTLAGDRMGVGDVPPLALPCAAHVIHSWSLRSPANADTVGGRWLERGAYAYVGSVHEPFLAAFVPPDALAARITTAVPLLVAARHWEGPFARPWRIATIGDPLMCVWPPGATDPRRRTAPVHEPRGELALAAAQRAMRDAMERSDATSVRTAIEALELAGQDSTAAELWRRANASGIGGLAAHAALGPLFRTGDADGFAEACSLALPQSSLDRDRLWAILLPTIRAGVDPDRVLLLEQSVRPEQTVLDARRLRDRVLEALGVAIANQMLDRIVERTEDNALREALRRLK